MLQSQSATCPPVFDWARNMENLDPCAVGSSLIALCNTSGQFEGLVPLPSGAVYPLPTSDNENKCTCSSIVYALVSVCSACQNAAYSSWSTWTSSCGVVYTPKFPVHTDISIPQWAIFDVQAEPTFNITRAQNSATPTSNVTDTPSLTEANSTSMTSTPTTETTSSEASSSRIPTTINPLVSEVLPSSSDIPTLSQTTSSAGIVPITQASTADPTSITSTNQSQSRPVSAASTKKGSKTGTVAGGTVAGIIILLIIGALVFWWIRRQRRSRMAPSAAYIAAYGTARPPINMSQQPYQGRGTISPFVTGADSNVPYHDEDFRASAYSDTRHS